MPILACVAACMALKPGMQATDKDSFNPKAVLNAFYERMHEATTAKGVITSTVGDQPTKTEFRMMRPNLFSLVSDDFEVRGDGKNLYVQTKGRRDPMRFEQSSGAPDIYGFEALTTDDPLPYVKAGKLQPGQFRGTPAYLIPISEDRPRGAGGVILYIDRKSLLPIACEFQAGGKSRFLAYENVELSVPMSRKDFLWDRAAG